MAGRLPGSYRENHLLKEDEMMQMSGEVGLQHKM
jgi:hypothetical protein